LLNPRKDRWTLLNQFTESARKNIPDEFLKMKVIYGHKTVKSFLEASQLFEFLDEPTSRGKRTLFKLKI
jgi:hypothetical protein